MSANSKKEAEQQRTLIPDAARLADVEEKHERVRAMLKAAGADALLLQSPANIAWFTAGADLFRFGAEDSLTSVFVTAEARLFATNSVDSAQIFEREVFGLGFQLKQRDWHRPPEELISDLCRGRKVISDRGPQGTKMARDRIASYRLPLTQLETQRLRTLSRVAVHAVEATAHHVQAGKTEAEIAGEVSHRLIKRTVTPARIQVCADGRNQRYRHWTFGESQVKNFVAIACSARRWGLHVSLTRTVCLDRVPAKLRDAFQKMTLVHATGMFFSRHNNTSDEIWKKVHRIYEKFGLPFEWQKADQADVIGYTLNEGRIAPASSDLLQAPVPVCWHPSVGPAMAGDTIICHENSIEQLTKSKTWPEIPVTVKGRSINCPGLLVKKSVAANYSDTSAGKFTPPDHPAEESPVAVESIWELPMVAPKSGHSVN